ncbi:MAG: single-stranded-DNA-specific exonuclease RecJ [Sphingobacteriaceae bacterium]|nr:single-stranded-DNA-specific exonuclease RecJ [Sphingobacteriaceae bacterium]
MEKKWVLTAQGDAKKTKNLAEALNIDEGLCQILTQRGIFTFEQARDFFRPQLSQLHNPFLMKDMDKAIERIELAVQKSEKILIYGDYDVDGTTSVTLAYSFFKQFFKNIEYYIPDRHKEGYGISTAGIDYAKANNFSLIIALDCGIKSVDKIDYANELGIDFIICDHHLPGEQLPKAIAVLDPKRNDCPYPFKELAGCGIGFKLIQAYCQKNHLSDEHYLQYVDLVMVSIAADIVPIVGENRILAHYGLIKLNQNPSAGLKALMEVSGQTTHYNISDVVFKIAPRINAAGRMDHAKMAVKMLLCETNEALDQSTFINTKNTERKDIDQEISREALEQLEKAENYQNKKTTVVFQSHWNKGVIGIVASRLTESYYRPTVVLTESNGFLTGSARSVMGFDLHEALINCSDLLTQFGGHQFAAGLTLTPENLPAFIEKFELIVANSITADQLIPKININTELKLTQINPKFQRILNQMEPFGPQNMSPVFESHQVQIVGTPNIVGTKHLKLVVKQENSDNFECIAFGLAEFAEKIKKNHSFSICYTIEENTWKDKKRIQLNIKGIKI